MFLQGVPYFEEPYGHFSFHVVVMSIFTQVHSLQFIVDLVDIYIYIYIYIYWLNRTLRDLF